MASTEVGGTWPERGEWGRTWGYLLQYLTNEIDPWDRGVLDAHIICWGDARLIQGHLDAARARRRGMLARLSAWRRRYLEGLIWVLGGELERRARVNQA